MTAKQLAFINEYPKDWNATNACIRAGYSANGARTTGSELLANPNIKKAIDERKAELTGASGITIERILQQLSDMAFGDRTAVFNEDGTMKPVSEWPKNIKSCITGIEIVEWDGLGIAKLKKIKMTTPDKAVEMLMRYAGMFEKDNKQKEQPININNFDLTQYTDAELRQLAELQRKGGTSKEAHT